MCIRDRGGGGRRAQMGRGRRGSGERRPRGAGRVRRGLDPGRSVGALAAGLERAVRVLAGMQRGPGRLMRRVVIDFYHSRCSCHSRADIRISAAHQAYYEGTFVTLNITFIYLRIVLISTSLPQAR